MRQVKVEQDPKSETQRDAVLSSIDDAKKNFKGQKEQEIKMPESLPEEPENNSKEKKKKKKEKKLISESESLPEEPENNSKEKKKKKKKKKLISESESLPEEPENNSKEKKKKKKKKKLTSESESLPSATEEKFKDASLEDRNVTDSKREKKTKDKEKKKKPPTSDSLGNNADSQATNSTVLNAHDTSVEGKSSKSKTKKKKKDDLAFESSGVNAKDTSVIGCTADDFKMSSAVAGANATGKDEKGSKKRKRLVSDENDLRPADKIEVEESKRRKIEGVENSVGNEQQAGIKKVDEFQNNSIKQLNDLENGSVVKSVEKSSVQKTTKKQPNGSAEPKTVCAFQRVKVDEVVFADEKLKDNSYWAKDGAETGYGAKAQEVLGQVRGRDFRHEKTKKKRGSYRGGQIDLQSHSVKFNYSDDE